MVLVSDSAKPDNGAASATAAGILRKLTPLAGIAGFLLVWQIFVVAWGVPAYLLPSPVCHRPCLHRSASAAAQQWLDYRLRNAGGLCHGGRHRHSAGDRDHVVAPLQSARDADDAVLPDHSEGGDRAIVPGLVRGRADAENPGRVPDFVLSDRDRRRRRPALDVVGNGRSRALDGCVRGCRCSRNSGCRPACRICSAA